MTSVFPALDDPEVAVDVLRGDLGLDDGRGQSIFSVDQCMVDPGELTRAARKNLRPGDEITLTTARASASTASSDWVSLQVSHDPAQAWVLTSAIALLTGLTLSLADARGAGSGCGSPRRATGGTSGWSSAVWPAPTARVTARSSTACRGRAGYGSRRIRRRLGRHGHAADRPKTEDRP